MQLKNSTILITGGSNGIGLEFAKQLIQQGAKVIITGRNLEKLEQVKKLFPQLYIVQSDVTDPVATDDLCKYVTTRFTKLNIIINNAGLMRSVELSDPKVNTENVTEEIDTNFSGTVRMVQAFLPHLMKQPSSAIINITSGLGYLPFTTSPIYCGTKAAVHIYSDAMRLKLQNTSVKVFEVAPPKTNKPLQTAVAEENSHTKTMKIEDVVSVAIKGILKDKYEIKPGLAKVMKLMSRIAPHFFTKMIEKNLQKAKVK